MARKRATASKAPSSSEKPQPAKSTKANGKSKAGPRIKTVERPADFPGIEGMVWADAATLDEHPDNWKTHTTRQLKALDAEFDTVGFVLPLAYNLTTGRLLDGHGRRKTDWVRKHKIVPVVVGRWSPEQEDQILLHLDPVGGMFETDGPKYRALMDRYKEQLDETVESINQEHAGALEALNDSLELHHEAIELGAPSSFLLDGTMYRDADHNPDGMEYTGDSRRDVVNMEDAAPILPGAFDLKTFDETPFNAFGPPAAFDIPFLRPDRMGTALDPLQTWGRTRDARGRIVLLHLRLCRN